VRLLKCFTHPVVGADPAFSLRSDWCLPEPFVLSTWRAISDVVSRRAPVRATVAVGTSPPQLARAARCADPSEQHYRGGLTPRCGRLGAARAKGGQGEPEEASNRPPHACPDTPCWTAGNRTPAVTPWRSSVPVCGRIAYTPTGYGHGYGLTAYVGRSWPSLTGFSPRNSFKLRSARTLPGGLFGFQDRRLGLGLPVPPTRSPGVLNPLLRPTAYDLPVVRPAAAARREQAPLAPPLLEAAIDHSR